MGTFYQGIIQQQQRDSNDNLVDAINLSGAIVGDQDKLQLQITGVE